MKKMLQLVKRNRIAILTFVFFMFTTTSAFASGSFTDAPKFVTGGVELIKQITNWLYGVIPVTAIAKFGYHSWSRSNADEEGEVQHHKKKMKNVVIWAPIALASSTLINLVLKYMT